MLNLATALPRNGRSKGGAILPFRELREFLDPDPVNPLGDHDLGVFAVANIAPENASAAVPSSLRRRHANSG